MLCLSGYIWSNVFILCRQVEDVKSLMLCVLQKCWAVINLLTKMK